MGDRGVSFGEEGEDGWRGVRAVRHERGRAEEA